MNLAAVPCACLHVNTVRLGDYILKPVLEVIGLHEPLGGAYISFLPETSFELQWMLEAKVYKVKGETGPDTASLGARASVLRSWVALL
jgi:hypothetical protein